MTRPPGAPDFTILSFLPGSVMIFRRERRAEPRLRNTNFATPFGEVVDVSGSGMAVTHRGPAVEIGQTIRVSISWSCELIEVDCVVRRVKACGFRRQTVGLKWIDPPAGLRDWLRNGHHGGSESPGPQVYRLPAVA
ncbi:PilZ domain-containing protein [Phycisphaera mikurensis]|uniref:PilZ domain-containing protein n=1 Tax=Phycisphaera mikurensis (strain NBRC 102666 / KCTC 22515 / FYK2301M01) TaxID=1142394 RepID=I0IFQ3_PHYMF|nr:PilZ domain-containing protein [Phycisphaera mikurensis]MBB6440519.1 hypothetical protein [Phycisphaera mikurensis]BAM04091.1 hypothetical protein PSMK_19320 [Phycisphaera mikurensis NBRC 102666]